MPNNDRDLRQMKHNIDLLNSQTIRKFRDNKIKRDEIEASLGDLMEEVLAIGRATAVNAKVTQENIDDLSVQVRTLSKTVDGLLVLVEELQNTTNPVVIPKSKGAK